MERHHNTALVTGATSGIGLELSRLFAKDGYNLVLVARDELTLYKVSDELKRLGAKQVLVISKDLSKQRGAEEVFMETSQAGIEVDVLVNDAGISHYGPFSEIALEKHLEIIQLNIVSLVTLTKLYMGGMIGRGQGHILQLAADAAFLPAPFQSVYAATKSFVLSFSDSLVRELKGSGVTVTALIPGPTDTDFLKKADAENTLEKMPQDPALVAKIGYNALVKGEHPALGPKAKKTDCR